MKKALKIDLSILALVIVLLAIKMLSTELPLGAGSPDVAFHAGKVLTIATYPDMLFDDPVTGNPSIYPAVYHGIAAIFHNIFNADNGYSGLRIFHVITLILLIFSVYFWGYITFGRPAALFSSAALTTIVWMPVSGYIFMPTPHVFGLLFMVNALAFSYLGLSKKNYFVLSGVLSGLGAVVWPIFSVVPIILSLYLILYRREFFLRYFLPMIISIAIVWVPQFMILLKNNLLNPASNEISPLEIWKFIFLGDFSQMKWLIAIFAVNYLFIITLTAKYLFKNRPHFFTFITTALFISTLLVYILFNPCDIHSYGRRFQFLFSIAILPIAGHYLYSLGKNRYKIVCVCLLILGLSWNYYKLDQLSSRADDVYSSWLTYGKELVDNLNKVTKDKEFILTPPLVYRKAVLGYTIRHALEANRDGTYFSLDTRLSQKLHRDLFKLMNTQEAYKLKPQLDKYEITYFIYVPFMKESYRVFDLKHDIVYANSLYVLGKFQFN